MSVVVVRVLTHGGLVVVPVAALARFSEMTRAQAIATVALLLLFAEVEHGVRARPDPARPGAPGTRLALASALGVLAIAWAAIGFPSTVTPLTWFGVPVVAVGIALRALAVQTLGASFTSEIVAIPGQALVTHGIYARMRHPSEAGLLLIAAGLATLGGSAAAAVLAAFVVAPTAVVRMAREDRVLGAHFANDHAAYRDRVSAIGVTRRATSRKPPGRGSLVSRCG